MKKLIDESKKCELLCGNCHAEKHWNDGSEKRSLIEKWVDKQSFASIAQHQERPLYKGNVGGGNPPVGTTPG